MEKKKKTMYSVMSFRYGLTNGCLLYTSGSGSVKKKIDDVFGHTLSAADKNALATLIYYPKEKMDLVAKKEKHMDDWYRITLYLSLIHI